MITPLLQRWRWWHCPWRQLAWCHWDSRDYKFGDRTKARRTSHNDDNMKLYLQSLNLKAATTNPKQRYQTTHATQPSRLHASTRNATPSRCRLPPRRRSKPSENFLKNEPPPSVLEGSRVVTQRAKYRLYLRLLRNIAEIIQRSPCVDLQYTPWLRVLDFLGLL